jgi:predicted DNA-binding transcriptional regulator AlpA
MVDSILTALNEAIALYNKSTTLTKQQRYDAVVSLAEWNLFNVQQLSQISGLSKSTIYPWVPENKRGHNGKLNPRTLDTLRQMRLNRNAKLPVSDALLNIALENGNSQAVVARLTGIAQSTIPRRVRDRRTRIQ